MSNDVDKGLWWRKFYPVDGDTAIAEMYVDSEPWADVRLEGIRLDEWHGERTRDARCVMRLYPPRGPSDFAPTGTHWEFDASEAMEQLRQAKEWLLENETGRVPIASDPAG